MKEVNIDELIKDYTLNGFGIYDICEKYHIGKIKAKALFAANGIEIKKRGRQKIDESEFIIKDFKKEKYIQKNGYHFEVFDPKTEFRSVDIKNKSGVLTTYIEKEYGIATPTLYDRRMYYMRTGNYWWEQWLNVEEKENNQKKKCPYCDWKTNDIENKSGSFEVHLITKHNITKKDYIKEHPEDKEYFHLINKTLNLQMEENENNFVVCKICGKKLTRITDIHLKSHGLTKAEYMDNFGISGTTCNHLHETMSKIAIEVNTNMTRDFSSSQEKEIKDLIESFGVKCRNDRKILRGKELDIYVPSKNIAIEFNGNLWHSEKYGKDKTYHLDKLVGCNNKGVKLLQIFEDEYEEHKDIVVSKIKHILGLDDKNSLRIPGRKCIIKEIEKEIAETFLNKNHIQGFVKSTLYIGAFFNGELIAVMSLLNENKGNWNLTRFASEQNYVMQGVAGKTFSYFIKKYNPLYVKSFADRRWTIDSTNNLYTKLGFSLDEILKPEYRYYNQKVDRYKRFHKFGFRKQTLHNKYGLPMYMTESEMTEKLGYTKIWDCGLYKYLWVNPNCEIKTEAVITE